MDSNVIGLKFNDVEHLVEHTSNADPVYLRDMHLAINWPSMWLHLY